MHAQVSRVLSAGLSPNIAAAPIQAHQGQPWYLCHYMLAVAMLSAICALFLPPPPKDVDNQGGIPFDDAVPQ